jgi:phosphoribosylformylglycinamidine synthase subunit PurQ / glutaminase
MRIGVVVFPGSNCDHDCEYVFRKVLGQSVEMIWHKDTSLSGLDAMVLPGGFSYGDYLRCGAMARFSPIMRGVVDFAREGGLVLGICNGFQILCEAGLLPGALVRNAGLHFVCRDQLLRVESTATAWTGGFTAGQELLVPIKSGEGRFVADPATLAQLEAENRVVFRYAGENPNGAIADIAGIGSADGRVVGLMPHPEHAVDPLTGPSTDGLGLFTSVLQAAVSAA